MPYALVTDAASEPVTTAQMKEHLNVDMSLDDTYIDLLVKAARVWTERYCKRAWITQTWRYTSDCGFENEIELYPSPVISVSSITYLDADGVSQTLSSSVYQTSFAEPLGRVKLAYNQTWPITRTGVYAAVTVNYTAGYGAAASAVPETIKHAIKLIVESWYKAGIQGWKDGEEPAWVCNLLNSERLVLL